MNEKQQQLTFDKGITNVPSDALCSDNSLSECVGMVYDNGEHKPIQKPVPEWGDIQPPQGIEEANLIFVHNINGVAHYIFWDYAANELFWADDEAVEHPVFGQYIPADPIIAANGKTLILSSKSEDTNLRYFVWKPQSNNYQETGAIPQPDVSFWFVNAIDNTDPQHPTDHYHVQQTNDFDENILSEGIAMHSATNRILNQDSFNNFVFGIYWQCENLVKEKKGFTRPFWLRYALRMYNGDYVYHSQPILVIPSWYNNCNLYIYKISDAKIDCIMYYGNLYYQVNTDYSDFSDIVKGIDVFVTDQAPLYLTDRADLHYSNRIGWLGYGGYQNPDYSIATMEARVDNFDNSLGTTLMKQRDHNDVIDDLVSMSTFYKISELGTSTTQRPEAIPIKDEVIKNITSQLTLQHDDYYSRTPLAAKYMGVYNHRLQLANVSRGFFDGFGAFVMAEYSSSAQYMAVVDIHTDSGDRTVRKEFESYEIIPFYFYYPDPRAYKVRIYSRHDSTSPYEKLYEKDLKEHPGLNGAYYLDLFDNTSYQPQQGVNPPEANKVYEELPNQFMQSEVDNPFVFYADGYTTVGDGDIVGFASQTTALSEGQFGQFPMMVFTSEGVWALAVSNTGLYTNAYPVSRDVCNNSDSITPTDGAVFFSTDKGLMLTIGKDVKHVSPQLQAGFIKFLSTKGTVIGYDYRDSLLWITNPNKTFAWIYNIKNSVFAKYTIAGVESVVNNYPDTILQISHNVFSLLKRPLQEDDESTYSACIISRPMKLENALALKSIMQIRHICQFSQYTVTETTQRGSMTLRIFASNNLDSWVELHSLRGTPWKYYKFRFDFSNLKATDRFAGTMLITQERRSNKLR